MGVSLDVGCPASGQVVRQILNGIADCVLAQTPFRRVLVSLHEAPLVPGSADSLSDVAAFVCRGVPSDQEQVLRRFVEQGGRVSGRVYVPEARVGRSFHFCGGNDPPTLSVRLPSSRTFLRSGTWQAQDALLSPFWSGDRIIGHISVDDPADGARPSTKTLAQIEKLAAVAAVALRDALEMESLSEAHKVFHFLAESAMTGVLVISRDEARYVNGRACELLGYDKDELLALSPWWQVIQPDDRPAVWRNDGRPPSLRGTARAVQRDGRSIWLASCAYPMEEPEDGGTFVLHFYDITDHVETEAQLKNKALRDPLTGLLNRSYFEDAIRTEMERSKRYKRPLTLMMGDLSRFKRINDRLGHQEGDRILAGVASVRRSQLRDSDWVVRFGGDEFLFVLPETGTGIETVEARLQRAVVQWCRENASDAPIGIDFGWATWTPDRQRDIADIVREADEMLYRKKAER